MKTSEIISLVYHDYFDYPLTKEDLTKWQTGKRVKLANANIHTEQAHGLYFLKNHGHLVKLRAKREKISAQKLKIAHHAVKFLKLIPTIKFVGLTGSLAMNNCDENSDIDFMIITKKGTLWSTRLFTLLFLKFTRFPLRSRGDVNEKDKLCLNIWMDEKDLILHDQNLYTAHELSQIIPLLNRGKVYEKLFLENSWITKFWPFAVKLPSKKSPLSTKQNSLLSSLFQPVELLSFKTQWVYMKNSITNETISRTRAFFHPINWSLKLESYLKKSNIAY